MGRIASHFDMLIFPFTVIPQTGAVQYGTEEIQSC